MKGIRSDRFMSVLGLCAIIGGLLSISGCSQGGDGVAIAAPAGSPFQEVTIANTPTNPVPTIDAGVKQPFAATANTSTSLTTPVTIVPPGKRLVIETITARTGLPPLSSDPRLLIVTGGVNIIHSIAVVPGGVELTGTHTVRFYADPSTNVTLSCFGPAASLGCAVTISGYLVDVPS